MNSRRLSAFFLTIALWVSPAAADPKTAMMGTMTEVSGSVEVQKRGTSVWVRATSGMQVGSGDQINSGMDGKAVLKFVNSTTEIRPLTQFTVGRAMESDKEYYTEMFLSVGKVVSRADPASGKPNKFTVTTPTAVAGIRGTEQEVSFGEGFGTESKIEDGQGYMAAVQADKLPQAVQMALGVASAPFAAPSAGGAEPGAPAAAVSAALDNWLEASFDNQVQGEGGAGGEAGEEPKAEGQAEEPTGGAEELAPLIDESVTVGEEMVIDDGLTGGVGDDPTDVESSVPPDEHLADETLTDITPQGAPEAEREAAATTTEISDEPVSEASVETATSEETTFQILEETVQTIGGTEAEVDLFGQPPAHP